MDVTVLSVGHYCATGPDSVHQRKTDVKWSLARRQESPRQQKRCVPPTDKTSYTSNKNIKHHVVST